MAITTANRCLRISLEIQPRSLIFSSLGKKRYNTSVPVRYIPKNYTQFKNPQKPPALESQEKKSGIFLGSRLSEGQNYAPKLPKFDYNERQTSHFCSEDSNSNDVFEQVEEPPELDDTYCSALEDMGTDVDDMSELMTDEVLNSLEDGVPENDDLLSDSVRQAAWKSAIKLLAGRAYTELELRKKLCGKKYARNIVESVVTDIKCRGLINDGLYAESFSQSRWLSLTWGPKRIKQYLVQKGVKAAEVDKAVKQVFKGNDVDRDQQTTQHGMSKVAMDRLFVQASKQWQRSQNTNTSPDNRKARVVRWLQYRGFSWGVTSAILKKLLSQSPP